jgi:dolichol-phosphate mannosyltransferase
MENKSILVIGSSGFVGSAVFEFLINNEYKVKGLGRKVNPWRISPEHLDKYILTNNENLVAKLNEIKPKIIINFAASGAYSFQNNFKNIISSNLELLDTLAKWALENGASIIHAGTSSEYGNNCSGPSEDSTPQPNSLYAITKLAGTHLLDFYSKKGLKSIVLRLYSVYGPKEDPSRLMPAVMRGIIKNDWPEFVNSSISRDFVYIEDINNLVKKLIEMILLQENKDFEIYNIGSGICTTIGDLTSLLMSDFDMPKLDKLNFPKRDWDVENWYANISKIQRDLSWKPEFGLKDGIMEMKHWYSVSDNVKYLNNEYSEKN